MYSDSHIVNSAFTPYCVLAKVVPETVCLRSDRFVAWIDFGEPRLLGASY